MKYRKLKINLRYAPDRLNRTFYVAGDISLARLAAVILTSFRTEERHLFEFIAQNKDTYGLSYGEPDYLLSEGSLKDLGDRFRFIYDYGDGWEFDCRLLQRTKEINSGRDIIFAEGTGLGIWEDNIHTFFAYISGEADPEMTSETEDEDADFYMPMNLGLEKLSEFDEPLDPEVEQELIDIAGSAIDESEEYEDPMLIRMQSGIWGPFSFLVDRALNGSKADVRADSWIAAFQEFENVCGVLKQENRLPDNFSELGEIEDGFMAGIGCIPSAVPDELIDAERFEECLEIVRELRKTFFFEDSELDSLNISEYGCLIRMERTEEALEFARKWSEQMPNSWNAKGCLVNAMTVLEKLKEAEALLKKVLTDDLECNEETYGLFVSAEQFYTEKGNTKKAEKLHAMIEEVNQRIDEQIKGEPWEEDPDDDSMDGSPFHPGLHKMVSIYKNDPNEELFTMAALSLVRLAAAGEMLCFTAAGFDGKGRLQLGTTDYEGRKYLTAYSMAQFVPDGYQPVILYLDRVLEIMEENRYGGICVDPDEDGALMVPLEILQNMRDFFRYMENTAGDFTDDDDLRS